MPHKAKLNLSDHGKIVEIETSGIVYDAISGHPDIFFFQDTNRLIVAPNTPQKYINILTDYGVNFVFGNKPVEKKYPASAIYNALSSSDYLIHNLHCTDEAILSSTPQKKIHCSQGYTRCNTIFAGETAITSDKGIESILKKHNIPVVYVDPSLIKLSGFKNGFFGGCCGSYEKYFFVCGKTDNEYLYRNFINALQINKLTLVQLYDGKLFDGGGILFIEY